MSIILGILAIVGGVFFLYVAAMVCGGVIEFLKTIVPSQEFIIDFFIWIGIFGLITAFDETIKVENMMIAIMFFKYMKLTRKIDKITQI